MLPLLRSALIGVVSYRADAEGRSHGAEDLAGFRRVFAGFRPPFERFVQMQLLRSRCGSCSEMPSAFPQFLPILGVGQALHGLPVFEEIESAFQSLQVPAEFKAEPFRVEGSFRPVYDICNCLTSVFRKLPTSHHQTQPTIFEWIYKITTNLSFQLFCQG